MIGLLIKPQMQMTSINYFCFLMKPEIITDITGITALTVLYCSATRKLKSKHNRGDKTDSMLFGGMK